MVCYLRRWQTIIYYRSYALIDVLGSDSERGFPGQMPWNPADRINPSVTSMGTILKDKFYPKVAWRSLVDVHVTRVIEGILIHYRVVIENVRVRATHIKQRDLNLHRERTQIYSNINGRAMTAIPNAGMDWAKIARKRQ